MFRTTFTLLCLFLCLAPAFLHAQKPPFLSLQPADTLHKPRLWAGVGTGTVLYGGVLVLLHRDWVASGSTSSFHTTNDLGDWNQMDKMGHGLLAYNQSRWLYAGARWAGIRPRAAAWTGFAGGQLMMATLEVFDGYSTPGGFSWSDMGANLLGSGLFLAQQIGWEEQRIALKVSAWPKDYPSEPLYPISPAGSTGSTTLQNRSDDIYGTGLASLFLKNYNANTVWLSLNPHSFFPQRATWLPKWLNVAVGMGADNLFAGQGYEWKNNINCMGPDCAIYGLDSALYPRTRQFYLSFDIDLTRLPVQNRFLRLLAGALNIIKIPAPALELTDRGDVRFHALHF
ncbi:MAG: DUF2279 domain-containing protein [Bacteroidetes bacterium]|nr:MAG: DUF2279 domain-containing protein [Bacteroidota bacterium]